MSDAMKRYVLSSAVTFASTFLLVLGANVGQISDPKMLTTSGIIAILMVASRAAVKAVIEAVAGGHADLPSFGTKKE